MITDSDKSGFLFGGSGEGVGIDDLKGVALISGSGVVSIHKRERPLQGFGVGTVFTSIIIPQNAIKNGTRRMPNPQNRNK